MPLTDAPFLPTLPAHDIERAMRWYKEKLGLTPLMDLGQAGQLFRTGGSLWVLYQSPSAGTGKHTLGGWIVPDLDTAMQELRSSGVTLEDYALGDQGPTTENGVARDESGGKVAWFIDSEGNTLALTQIPPGMSLPGAGT